MRTRAASKFEARIAAFVEEYQPSQFPRECLGKHRRQQRIKLEASRSLQPLELANFCLVRLPVFQPSVLQISNPNLESVTRELCLWKCIFIVGEVPDAASSDLTVADQLI